MVPSPAPLPSGTLPHCGHSGTGSVWACRHLGTCVPGRQRTKPCHLVPQGTLRLSHPRSPTTRKPALLAWPTPHLCLHTSPSPCVPPPQITDPSGGFWRTRLAQKRDPWGHSGVLSEAGQSGRERKVWEGSRSCGRHRRVQDSMYWVLLCAHGRASGQGGPRASARGRAGVCGPGSLSS